MILVGDHVILKGTGLRGIVLAKGLAPMGLTAIVTATDKIGSWVIVEGTSGARIWTADGDLERIAHQRAPGGRA